MDLAYSDIVLVPIIMAISKLLTSIGFNSKFIPIVNLFLGLVGGIIYLNPADIKLGILQGLVMGLTASGMYSSFKNVSEGIK